MRYVTGGVYAAFVAVITVVLLASLFHSVVEGRAGAQQPTERASDESPGIDAGQIGVRLAAKEQRTARATEGEFAAPGRAAGRCRPSSGDGRGHSGRDGDGGHPGRRHAGGAGAHPGPGRHGHQQRGAVPGHPGAAPARRSGAAGRVGRDPVDPRRGQSDHTRPTTVALIRRPGGSPIQNVSVDSVARVRRARENSQGMA